MPPPVEHRLDALILLIADASLAAVRRRYQSLLTGPVGGSPLQRVQRELEILRFEPDGPRVPPTPRDGTCPVCDAVITTYDGHGPDCPMDVACPSCSGSPARDCYPPCGVQAYGTDGLDMSLPWDATRQRLPANEVKRLLALLTRHAARLSIHPPTPGHSCGSSAIGNPS